MADRKTGERWLAAVKRLYNSLGSDSCGADPLRQLQTEAGRLSAEIASEDGRLYESAKPYLIKLTDFNLTPSEGDHVDEFYVDSARERFKNALGDLVALIEQFIEDQDDSVAVASAPMPRRSGSSGVILINPGAEHGKDAAKQGAMDVGALLDQASAAHKETEGKLAWLKQAADKCGSELEIANARLKALPALHEELAASKRQCEELQARVVKATTELEQSQKELSKAQRDLKEERDAHHKTQIRVKEAESVVQAPSMAVWSHLEQGRETLPQRWLEFATALLNMKSEMDAVEKGVPDSLLSKEGLARLDAFLYSPPPTFGAAQAGLPSENINPIAIICLVAAQTELHTRLQAAGMTAFLPQPDDAFDAGLHQDSEQDQVIVSDRARHNRIQSARRMGYSYLGQVKRKATVIRYIVSAEHVGGPALPAALRSPGFSNTPPSPAAAEEAPVEANHLSRQTTSAGQAVSAPEPKQTANTDAEAQPAAVEVIKAPHAPSTVDILVSLSMLGENKK